MAKRKPKFIHRPVYPGGAKALRQFIRDRLQYPEQALEKRTEGTVTVAYSLNQSGKVVRAKATEGPGDGCRQEAVRLVKLLRFRVPKDYKMTVQYHQHLDIHFRLPKPQKKATDKTINYEIVPAKPKENPPPGKRGSGEGYSYTITF